MTRSIYAGLGEAARLHADRAIAAYAGVEAHDAALRREIAETAAAYAQEVANLRGTEDFTTARALEEFRRVAEKRVDVLEARRDALRARWSDARRAAMRAEGRAAAVAFLHAEEKAAARAAAEKREEMESAVLTALRRAQSIRRNAAIKDDRENG